MSTAPNFSDADAYRYWLETQYWAEVQILLKGETNPPRSDYRVVDPESIDAMTDRATWHVHEAQRLFKLAKALRDQTHEVL